MVSVGSMFGIGYMTVSQPAEAAYNKIAPENSSPTYNAFKKVSDYNSASFVASRQLTGSTIMQVSDLRTYAKSKKSISTVNFERKLYSGNTAGIQQMLKTYNELGAGEKILGKIEITDPASGEKKYLQITADAIITPEGKKIKLNSDSIAQAIRGGALKLDGTLNIKVSDVKGFEYLDENGVLQTQSGFSLLSYEYTQGFNGTIQTGSIIINPGNTEIAAIDAEPSEEMLGEFTFTNAELVNDSQYSKTFEITLFYAHDMMTKAYEDAVKEKSVLEMIDAVTKVGDELSEAKNRANIMA